MGTIRLSVKIRWVEQLGRIMGKNRWDYEYKLVQVW